MLSLGKKAKLSFKVDALVDGKAVTGPFADLLVGPTIVSVYMRNNTSACDKQAAEMDKNEKAIVRQGFRLVAVSRDTCASHAKYAAKHGYGFTLVADPEDLFSQAMDAIVEKSMYGKKYLGPLRAAYLFDATGKLIGLVPKVDAAAHGQQLLDAITAVK
ncbi:MAG: peroxiredoxin [Opitutia bacterium]|nr:redoxin domain-containing protein [Opitutales bacterium]PHX79518.1 MAG: peroxiredoxin [Opitutae bacterium]